MSTFIIWSDLTKAEQDKKLEEILAVAALDDFILYQGANQMDLELQKQLCTGHTQQTH